MQESKKKVSKRRLPEEYLKSQDSAALDPSKKKKKIASKKSKEQKEIERTEKDIKENLIVDSKNSPNKSKEKCLDLEQEENDLNNVQDESETNAKLDKLKLTSDKKLLNEKVAIIEIIIIIIIITFFIVLE